MTSRFTQRLYCPIPPPPLPEKRKQPKTTENIHALVIKSPRSLALVVLQNLFQISACWVTKEDMVHFRTRITIYLFIHYIDVFGLVANTFADILEIHNAPTYQSLLWFQRTSINRSRGQIFGILRNGLTPLSQRRPVYAMCGMID